MEFIFSAWSFTIKFHRGVVNNVDVEVRFRRLKLLNDNRFDKNVPHFPKLPLYDFTLDD